MINVTVLMGRMVADPELKTTPNGNSVCSFRIAVERRFPGSNGERQTDFINIVAWRSTAEFICRYFTKGQMIAVHGHIQTRPYEDKQGNKRTAVEVVADNVSFCGSKREGQQEARQSAQEPQQASGYWNQGSSYAPSGQKPAQPQEPETQQAFGEGFEEVFGPGDDLPF